MEDDRHNLHRVNDRRLKQVSEAIPTKDELAAYATKYNLRQINSFERHQYLEDFRVIDPRRWFRYVGLGNTKDYDWVQVSGNNGFEFRTHYRAADLETMIALLNVY